METLSNAPAVAGLAERYLTADEQERMVVEATLRCVGRWGLAKTTFEDIAREAGVSRATVYRVVPGGKERLVDVVIRYELGRVAHEISARAEAAETLEDLLCLGIVAGIRLLTEHEVLQYLLAHEPGTVMPHFAFNRLESLFAVVTELAEPYAKRFLPPDDIPPAVELVVRVVLSYSMFPSTSTADADPAETAVRQVDLRDQHRVDPHRPESIRQLVRVYLLPAVTTASPATTGVETSKTSERTENIHISESAATSELPETREL